MGSTFTLSDPARTTAGILLIAIVTIEFGGTYLLRIVRGSVPATPFQLAFARAGHAHAGVLVILALVCQLYVDAIDAEGITATVARSGVALRGGPDVSRVLPVVGGEGTDPARTG